MFKVNNAQTMMVVEYDDKPCALVEVELQGHEDEYIAGFSELRFNTLELMMVYRRDASEKFDWFDNDLHQAFQEVSSGLFGGGEAVMGSSRAAFVDAVLSFGSVREDIRTALKHYSIMDLEAAGAADEASRFSF